MNHEHFQELISLHVDNALDDGESAELFAHLATCDVCRRFMRTTMNVRSHIAGEELSETPPALDRRIVGVVHAQAPFEHNRNWFAPLWGTRISIPLPAAASLAILILFCTLLISPLLISKTPQSSTNENSKSIPAEFQKHLEMYR